MYKVIDVSKHNGNINWRAVKESGIVSTIIRCGFGDDITSQDDPMWIQNVNGAKEAGLKIGAYLYSYADSTAHAQSEAEHAIRLLHGISLDLPIFYDMEDETTTGKCSSTLLGDMAEIFCRALQDAGYQVGIYANKNWFTNKLTDPRFSQWDKWVAQYYTECTYEGEKVGWQYTSTGSANGVQGNVDISEFYKDYSSAAPVQPAALLQFNANYQVYTDQWLPAVKNLEDYAGWAGKAIKAVAVKVEGKHVRYRVHTIKGKWYPYVDGYNLNDIVNGFAGDLKNAIDAVEIIVDGAVAVYRVQASDRSGYFSWQHNNQTGNGQDGYAGLFGHPITKFQMYVK